MSKILNTYQIILLIWGLILLTGHAAAQELPSKHSSIGQSVTYAARIGHKSGGTINKDELLGSNELSLIAPYDTLFQILNFRLTRVRKGDFPMEINNDNGGELTDSMKDLINNSFRGDKIYFEYIKCKANDGTQLSINALSFVLE